MGALLAILTFAVFILVDWLLTRRAAQREAEATIPVTVTMDAGAARAEPAPHLEPVWVSGYNVPDALHYHRGHTWARVEGPDTVAVGVDDFARRLIGRAEGVKLPLVGAYVRQGGRGAHLDVNGRGTDVLSPMDGEVVEVNEAVATEPHLATDDPYGRGWLFKVRSTNLPAGLKNLLSGSLARRWVEDAREQLELRLMALSGSVLQDGGEPAPDFATHLDTKEWKGLVETFLLAETTERKA